MKDFKGKNVFITGGSSGIGLSIARILAEKGAHIIIFARNEERLERALKEVTACSTSEDQRFSCLRMDVSDPKEGQEVMSKAISEFGPPKVLINCAGRAYPHYFKDVTFDQFNETMKINLYGIWNTVAFLVPYMMEKGGYIVNVSSMAGFVGVFGYTDYSASKFAVIGFSEVLRSELKSQDITISVLCPPDTDTPGFEVENMTKPEETRAISAKAKLMHPNEVALALLKGMKKEKFLIIPGFDGKLTYLIKRLFPWLIEYLMGREIRKVQRRGCDIKRGEKDE